MTSIIDWILGLLMKTLYTKCLCLNLLTSNYCGLLATQCLILGRAPTLSTRFFSKGYPSQCLGQKLLRNSLNENKKMSAQVRALPAKYCPPLDSRRFVRRSKVSVAFSFSLATSSFFLSSSLHVMIAGMLPIRSRRVSTISSAWAFSRLFRPARLYSLAKNLDILKNYTFLYL